MRAWQAGKEKHVMLDGGKRKGKHEKKIKPCKKACTTSPRAPRVQVHALLFIKKSRTHDSGEKHHM
jgi:hypothetical protein